MKEMLLKDFKDELIKLRNDGITKIFLVSLINDDSDLVFGSLEPSLTKSVCNFEGRFRWFCYIKHNQNVLETFDYDKILTEIDELENNSESKKYFNNIPVRGGINIAYRVYDWTHSYYDSSSDDVDTDPIDLDFVIEKFNSSIAFIGTIDGIESLKRIYNVLS